MRTISTLVIGLLIYGGYSLWDGSHHDHSEAHGTPVMASMVEKQLPGTWSSGTETLDVSSGTCHPGDGGEPNVHFRCELLLKDGTTRTRLIHILYNPLGDTLMMRE